MTAGRRPLPANIHVLNGNPSKKRFAAMTDGSRVPIEIPEAPAHIDAAAKKEWKRITVELEKLGLIAKIDRAALGIYCQAYSRWEHAEKEIKKLGNKGLIESTPSGYKQVSVWLQISNRAIEQMHKMMGEFGMTPSARSRVTINPQADLFGSKDEPAGSPKPNPSGQYFKS